jgi:hypothetical protein
VSDAPLVYARLLAGHRASYVRFTQRLLGARRARIRDVFFARAPVLFLMIEEAFLLYIVASLWRAMTGRRTVGLLFRPLPAATSRSLRHRSKRLALRMLTKLDAVRTLTILPFDVAPGFAAIARGWIYDFQFWDLTDEERGEVDELRAKRRLNGRLVVTALGAQNRRKGFDLFALTYARVERMRNRFLFISCGRIVPALAGHAQALAEAGGVAVNREMSDAELLGSYAASDIVWCLYPPLSDQSSGILGRAVQLGIPVLVRRDSLVHRLCVIEQIPHLATTAEGVAERLAGSVPPRDGARGRALAARFAADSEATLRAALGLKGRGKA